MAKKIFTDESLATFVNEVKSYTNSAVSSHNHAASNITSGTLSSDRLPTVPIAKGGTGATTAAAALTNLGITATAAELNKLDGVTATTTELNYIDGVTSSIQTQLDGKAASSHPHAITDVTGLQSALDALEKAIEEAEINSSNKDVVVLAEAQKYTDAEIDKVEVTLNTLQGVVNGKAASNHTHDDTYLPLTGGRITGSLSVTGRVELDDVLSLNGGEADLSVDTETRLTINQQPVALKDDLNNYLELSGGEITGNINVGSGIVLNATDNYVYSDEIYVGEGDDVFISAEGISTSGNITSGNIACQELIVGSTSYPHTKIEHYGITTPSVTIDEQGVIYLYSNTGIENYDIAATGYGFNENGEPVIYNEMGRTIHVGDDTMTYNSYIFPEKDGTIALTSDIPKYITTGAKSDTTIGGSATAEGYDTTASSYYSHAEGYRTTSSNIASHAEGIDTVASGQSSHAEGCNTTASDGHSHAEGYYTTASGFASHAEGNETTASGNYSHAGGYGTTANAYQYVVGRYNVDTTAPASLTDKTATTGMFIVGIGTSDSDRTNGFRVTASGKVYGTGTFGISGADYAEYFEWLDGNPNNEDRRGRFVTLEGNKIRYATPNDDYILGVVSADPSVVGDVHSEDWHNRYLKDVFGSKIVEVVEVEETTNEDGKIIPTHTERRWVLNPDYNPDVKYTSREERPEWAAIGIVGKLVVVDDGTCQVNGYCYPNADGIATASQEKTNYRVMERLDDTHIRIFIR